MTKMAREQLARLLGDSEPAGSFSAQLLAPAHFLQLEVSGVGPASLPDGKRASNPRPALPIPCPVHPVHRRSISSF